MTFMKKILDMLNMDNWESEDAAKKITEVNDKEQVLSFLQSKIDTANKLIEKARNASDKTEFDNCIAEIKLLFFDFEKSEPKKEDQPENKSSNAYDKYYENIRKQRESNLCISYEDVKFYDMNPFDLKGNYISDGNFTAIELSGRNLEIAYKCLKEINTLLLPHKALYENAVFPNKIDIDYEMNRKLPISHLRLMPHTATMRKSKYPLCLWISSHGYYGTEYLYSIYFDKDGNIGQCELSLHGSGGIGISYETKIRRNDGGLYILRISKTLYSPPYGTTTIYHQRDSNTINKKPKIDNEYDLERYARECNAYIVREERRMEDNT